MRTQATPLHTPLTGAGPLTAMHVIRSEWTKFRSVRSSWWTIAVSVALTLGLGVTISLAAAADHSSSALPRDIATRSELGTVLAQLALGTLAVLVISGEYGTGMIRSSMTVVPKRLPVLWAKLAVYVGVLLPVTMVTSVATFLLSQFAWRTGGRVPASLADGAVAQIVIGASLYLTLAGICANAIATLLRNAAAGITVVVGLFFVLPTVLEALPAGIADAARFLPSNAGAAMSRLATSPRSLPPWTGLGLLGCYAIVLVAAAAWRLQRTDV